MLPRARQAFAVFLFVCISSIALTASAADLPDFTGIVQRNGPAVVNVQAHYNRASEIPDDDGGPGDDNGGPGDDDGSSGGPDDQQIPDIFKRFFGIPLQPPGNGPDRGAESMGSGFIISADGYILTNNHVVDHADSVTVKLTDRRELPAKVVGTDPQYDIALLKINAGNLPVVTIGDSRSLKPGQWVVAIGSPFGFDNSVTQGIVSAVGRSFGAIDQQYVPFIQTDVPINRGNSGGPLFNLDGQVVGINSQIFSNSGGYMGVSFSIPIDIAMNAAQQIKSKGYVSRGVLGVGIQQITADIAKAKNLHLTEVRGALVGSVTPGSGADKAGIQVGDVILAFNGHPVYDAADLPPMVGATQPGSMATVQISRDGKLQNVQVKVGELPRDKDALQAMRSGRPSGGDSSSALGLAVQTITPAMRQQLDLKDSGGVAVTAARGAAAQAGLQPGDVILRVGNKPVDNAAAFKAAGAGVQPGDTVLLLVSRGGASQFVAVTVPKK
ncbi:MAG TPA: Do family serine endopeptidase [Rhodanobacteraceae bacterium]|nr:Do family serine endopeptidase [Rhodanobacteraceae bacterium]